MNSVRCVSYCWMLVVVLAAITSATDLDTESDMGVNGIPQVLPIEGQEAEVHEKTGPNAESTVLPQEPQFEIMELAVNDNDVNELFMLHDDINKEALNVSAAADGAASSQSMQTTRLGRSMESSTQENSDALSDEDINKLVQMISFPSQAMRAHNEKNSQSADATVDEDVPAEVEPRSNRKRGSRALNSRGYYILAFSPINGPLTPTYTKLDIIPVERALDGDLAVRKANKQRGDNDLMMSGSEVDEARLISMKQFNRYVRRLMKQIRKGTRKIQRKTRFKSKSASEPTVENFLRKLYAQREVQKKKTSWFSW
uniref:Uncharacterized protein n=1 Tax=Bactrocera dorsalis TaxID=27457 RepID=A0A034WBI0_BACDO